MRSSAKDYLPTIFKAYFLGFGFGLGLGFGFGFGIAIPGFIFPIFFEF